MNSQRPVIGLIVLRKIVIKNLGRITALLLLILLITLVGCAGPATSGAVSPSSVLKTTELVSSIPSSSLNISAEETRQLIDRDTKVVLVDIRPDADFKKSHLEPALSVPVEALAERYSEIPRGPQVVVYASCA